MRRNDQIFKSNRMPLGPRRSKKKRKTPPRQAPDAQLPLMPSFAISLSSREDLEQKNVKPEDKGLSGGDGLPGGTLDSTQLKSIKQDLVDPMDDLLGPLDIKRTRIDSVRNTGLLCRECLALASQAHEKEDGVHIPHCKTVDCVNYRENRSKNNFDFSEIEEDFGEDLGGFDQETARSCARASKETQSSR